MLLAGTRNELLMMLEVPAPANSQPNVMSVVWSSLLSIVRVVFENINVFWPASIFHTPALRSHCMMIPGRQFLPSEQSPRRRFLFVGNLSSNVAEDGLKTFIAQLFSTSSPSMTVAISQCSLFKKEKSTSARIVVNARDASFLLDQRFWPRPVYTRSWNFEKYSSKDKADSDTETDESPTRRRRAVSAQISATEKQNDEKENARRTTDVLHDAIASSVLNASPLPESEVITRSQCQQSVTS